MYMNGYKSALPWHTETLRALLGRRDRLHHAMLVRGQEGIGKLHFARAAAQALLCEQPKAGLACGACTACNWFEQGSHPDFRLLQPESLAESPAPGEGGEGRERKPSVQIAVDRVRELTDFLNLSSHRGGVRVTLIHPAESLNPNAANA